MIIMTMRKYDEVRYISVWIDMIFDDLSDVLKRRRTPAIGIRRADSSVAKNDQAGFVP